MHNWSVGVGWLVGGDLAFGKYPLGWNFVFARGGITNRGLTRGTPTILYV